MARWGSQGGGGGCSRGHRVRDERGLEGRWPHVLARRAHKINLDYLNSGRCSPDARSLRPPALLPPTNCNGSMQEMMTRAIRASSATPLGEGFGRGRKGKELPPCVGEMVCVSCRSRKGRQGSWLRWCCSVTGS